LYPMTCLAHVLKTLSKEFPTLPVTIYVETLGSTAERLHSGQCDIAIVGPLIASRHDIDAEPLRPIKSVAVCAPDYPLAEHRKPLTKDDLHQANQLVLTDRSKITEGQDFGVYSPSTWRLSDIGAKHELLRAGLGWGFMPLHLVEKDLASGALVQIRIADMPSDHRSMGFAIALRPENPPGPGGRRFIELIKSETSP
ncbi:MAG: LysR family transcriptional regulator, partial [Alphaproteobacteria bacterium]